MNGLRFVAPTGSMTNRIWATSTVSAPAAVEATFQWGLGR